MAREPAILVLGSFDLTQSPKKPELGSVEFGVFR